MATGLPLPSSLSLAEGKIDQNILLQGIREEMRWVAVCVCVCVCVPRKGEASTRPWGPDDMVLVKMYNI